MLALWGLTACSHTVDWDPIHYETSIERIGDAVQLHMDDDLQEAEYSFRAFSSGIANKWVVPYGERVKEFAEGYLSRAFTSVSEVDDAEDARGGLVDIQGVEYEVSGQSAHVSLTVEHRPPGRGGAVLRSYQASGPSGTGVVFVGGAFAQKGMVRRSTNRALHDVFGALLSDLEKLWVPGTE
jgi:hypothetical protein